MAACGTVFDVCVIGAGIEGSATARYLASRGKKTLLLEQFPLPHTQGSSHGHTRLVRYGYPETFNAALMPEAFQMWDEIAKKSGRSLIRTCGLLTVEGPPYAELSLVINNVRSVGQECQQLSADQINKRFPGLSVLKEECGSFEPASGFIQADLALKSLQEQYLEFGGILHDSEKVEKIQPGPVVEIQTNKNSYKAKSIVITVGSWVNRVLKPLGISIPLEIQRMSVCYWKADPQLYSPDKFPGFIFSPKDFHIYGIPIFEYPGLIKICPHIGPDISDPDRRDDFGQRDKYIQMVSELIKSRFTDVNPAEPSIVDTCMYSVTPDHRFVLDRHPGFNNIVIGAGFSGHGFKMAPVVGKILSQMALGEQVSYDVLPFRLSRFNRAGTKSSL